MGVMVGLYDLPMASDVQKLNVLIASPGDAGVARDLIERALHDWNSHRGDAEKIFLQPQRWEINSVPLLGRGDAQSVINTQMVDEADIVFAVFYHRLGSPTARSISGTAEEINASVRGGKLVHLYFAEKPMPYSGDLEQFAALRKFRLEMQKAGLITSYRKDRQLRTEVAKAIDYDVAILKLAAQTQTDATRAPARVRERAIPERLNLSGDRVRQAQKDLATSESIKVRFRPAGKYPTKSTPQRTISKDHLLITNRSTTPIEDIEVKVRSGNGELRPLTGPARLLPKRAGSYIPYDLKTFPTGETAFPVSVGVTVRWSSDGEPNSAKYSIEIDRG